MPIDRPPVVARRLLGAATSFLAFWIPILATLSTAPLPAQDAARPTPTDAPVTALKVGTLHTATGPAIDDAVVLILRGRVAAVGPATGIVIPAGARVLDLGDAHAWPGLVDARTDAFAGEAATSSEVDAGAEIRLGLDRTDRASRGLAASGVTTAYVANRSSSQWRGQGVVIRTTGDSFEILDDHATAGLGLRMTAGPGASHPLQRRDLAKVGKGEFESLEKYEEAFEEYEEKKKEYDEKFEEWLAWHRKKSGKDGDEKTPSGETKDGEKKDGEAKSGDDGEAPDRGKQRGGRKPGGDNEQNGEKEKASGDGEAGSGGGKPADGGDGKNADDKKADDKEPERPEYPSEPKRDPAKEAFLEVRDGELPLRIEAHRPDEIRFALARIDESEIPGGILLEATGADSNAIEAIARAGVPVIVSDVFPRPEHPYLGGEPFDGALAARLVAADIRIAIAGGRVERTKYLPMLAATAIGNGLDADAALRAITLDAARILGLDADIGSLETGKLADLVVTDGPLFDSDTTVVRVLSAGETIYEVDA